MSSANFRPTSKDEMPASGLGFGLVMDKVPKAREEAEAMEALLVEA
jgi:hypothetical protein